MIIMAALYKSNTPSCIFNSSCSLQKNTRVYIMDALYNKGNNKITEHRAIFQR